MDTISLYEYTIHGQVTDFHLLVTVNNATMNTDVQVSVWVPTFSAWGIYPELELLDRMVILCLAFWGTAQLFPTAPSPFYMWKESENGLWSTGCQELRLLVQQLMKNCVLPTTVWTWKRIFPWSKLKMTTVKYFDCSLWNTLQ